jgi:hypothetical protein
MIRGWNQMLMGDFQSRLESMIYGVGRRGGKSLVVMIDPESYRGPEAMSLWIDEQIVAVWN